MTATIAPADLLSYLRAVALEIGPHGAPSERVVVVDLDRADVLPMSIAGEVADVLTRSALVGIGRAARPTDPRLNPLIDALTCTVTPHARTQAEIGAEDVDTALETLCTAVRRAPRAASTLDGVLRLSAESSVAEGLVAESMAYSMLLAGPEFARWRAARPTRPMPVAAGPAVFTATDGRTLRIVLSRPERRNAFGRDLRDALVDALDHALASGDIDEVVVTGAGPAFCSGGDLDEFGTSPDVATAHLVRLDRSAGARVHRLGERCTVVVHGACIGAGIEIPAFAGRVIARTDAFFQLPEITMGLIPGAGGTVSIARRVGRWRTAYLALTGTRLDAATAHEWGLVDAVAD